MTTPPSREEAFGVYWPALVSADAVPHRVVLADETIEMAPTRAPAAFERPAAPPAPALAVPGGPTREAPLGLLCGARSGDKGGNANVGVWVKTPEAYVWLERFLTVDRLRALLVEARGLEVERHALPNLLALNFVLKGLLGDGVAASLRADPQAKSLGEYLRAKLAPIPLTLLG
jgi:hypothetical protein